MKDQLLQLVQLYIQQFLSSYLVVVVDENKQFSQKRAKVCALQQHLLVTTVLSLLGKALGDESNAPSIRAGNVAPRPFLSL